jgi:hypothetical protein
MSYICVDENYFNTFFNYLKIHFMKKRVIYWEVTSYKQNPDSPAIGKLKTKVSPTTNGAIRFVGKNDAGKSWDYYGKVVDSVVGRLVWIDKVVDKFNGARILMVLESEKYLSKIHVPYSSQNQRDIINRLLGLGKALSSTNITMTYWVRPKKDKSGTLVLNDKNQQIMLKNILLKDIEPKFSFEGWKEYAEKNGLDWVQSKDAKGRVTWDDSAESKFWDGQIAAIQKFLINEDVAVPFSFNSFICGDIPNPSGGPNLSKDLIDKANEMYQSRKNNYEMSNATQSSDDLDFSETNTPSTFSAPANVMESDDIFSSPNPAVATTKAAPKDFASLVADDDDLPF